MGQNQSDFHQFSWSPAFSDIIFINEFNLFTFFPDLPFYLIPFGKPPHHKAT